MQVGSHELFWCHHCNRNHDVCREAPLCGISIVTWNFSFELVLSFALFGQGLWEAPVLTTVLQRQRFMHWDGPSLMVQLWSPMWYVQNTSPKIVCDLEIMKKLVHMDRWVLSIVLMCFDVIISETVWFTLIFHMTFYQKCHLRKCFCITVERAKRLHR